MSDSLQASEELAARGATAPRVSIDDIKAAMKTIIYRTGEDLIPPDAFVLEEERAQLRVLTICLVVMENGYTLIGKSAPASPENFDPEKGKQFAREDVVRQIWPLMGFNLRQKLYDASKT